VAGREQPQRHGPRRAATAGPAASKDGAVRGKMPPARARHHQRADPQPRASPSAVRGAVRGEQGIPLR
jgi:hypothetical protein